MIALTTIAVCLICIASLIVFLAHTKQNRTWCFSSVQKNLDSYGLTTEVLSHLGMNNSRFRNMDIRVRQFSNETKIDFNDLRTPILVRRLSISRFKRLSRNVTTQTVTDSTFKE